MAHRLIAAVGVLAFLGLGGDRLVERPLPGVGAVSVPARATPLGDGTAWDDDPARLYFRFAREYRWASIGSSTAYRQLIAVSLLAPDATPADYARWPPRFEPLYSRLGKEREIALGSARVTVAGGRYAQNALDEPAHVYTYADAARRLQIAWHVVDADVAPADALRVLERMAESFVQRDDPRAKFAAMRGRGARERERTANAVQLARESLARAGFGAAAPGRPVLVNGVYAEWMDDPEPRFQLVKPLGLARAAPRAAPTPRTLPGPDGRVRTIRGSVGWRSHVDDAWVVDNRDGAYLPLPGIARELARLQPDAGTTLYFHAQTVRIAHADAATIAALGEFHDDLPAVERAWREGSIASGVRLPLPAPLAPAAAAPARTRDGPSEAVPAHATAREYCGIDLATGDGAVDEVRRRLATAARAVAADVDAGHFEAAESAVLAVDREIQAAVVLGAMYTAALRRAVARGERESRPDWVAALHARAVHWRTSAYPEPHTAVEADDYAAGRAADRAELAAMLDADPPGMRP